MLARIKEKGIRTDMAKAAGLTGAACGYIFGHHVLKGKPTFYLVLKLHEWFKSNKLLSGDSQMGLYNLLFFFFFKYLLIYWIQNCSSTLDPVKMDSRAISKLWFSCLG